MNREQLDNLWHCMVELQRLQDKFNAKQFTDQDRDKWYTLHLALITAFPESPVYTGEK